MRPSVDQCKFTIGSLVDQNPVVWLSFKPDKANPKQGTGARKRIHK
ncbi:hypothetical protein [Endozoicomonas montiporae]|nr:hypothetical protein [Endozoicomonas montiporae]